MNRRDTLLTLSAAAGTAFVPRWVAAAAPVQPELVRIPVSDGASLALDVGGAGLTVLLVHGSGTTRRSWFKVAPLLQPHFRTYALDRRGRGDSTDGPSYSLQREAQDIAEVADALPGPVFVVGHSIGAIMTLEALRLTPKIQKAVLYEPPLPVPGGMEGGSPNAVCDAVAAGDNDRAMTIFFKDYALMSQPTVDAFRADPMWLQRVKLAPTVCREATAHFNYRFDPSRFSHVFTPTLFLLGGNSPKPMAVSTRAGAGALQHSQLEILPGQEHVATQMAPGLLASDIAAFFPRRRRDRGTFAFKKRDGRINGTSAGYPPRRLRGGDDDPQAAIQMSSAAFQNQTPVHLYLRAGLGERSRRLKGVDWEVGGRKPRSGHSAYESGTRGRIATRAGSR